MSANLLYQGILDAYDVVALLVAEEQGTLTLSDGKRTLRIAVHELRFNGLSAIIRGTLGDEHTPVVASATLMPQMGAPALCTNWQLRRPDDEPTLPCA